MKKKSILVGLNELNFEFIQGYIEKGFLPNLKILFSRHGYQSTTSETHYDLLEPWIQWPSIHTGRMYNDHKIFRLGDIVNRPDIKQLWEIAEEKGLKVGAVSPFNARNNLKKPLFFVPDPWTQTSASGSKTLVDLSRAVSKAVNSNANNKLEFHLIISIVKGLIKYVPIRKYFHYLHLAGIRLKKKSTKSAILDNILADTFITLWRKKQPDFSSLFLNSGAHLQHHYMFNSTIYTGKLKNPEWYCPSSEDPMLDILIEYDKILGQLMQLKCRLFIATGLHQNPHHQISFYWRLKDHSEFLKIVGIKSIKTVIPRMSRDFLIEFEDASAAAIAYQQLEGIKSVHNNKRIFTLDNRGDSLFVELTYSDDIKPNFKIAANEITINIDFHNHVSFVAIKNGAHNGIGYFIDTEKKYAPEERIKITDVFTEIVSSF